MKKIIKIIGVLFFAVTLFSCTKGGSSGNNTTNNQYNFSEDPNNYFTATFSGKTLKTSGILSSLNTVVLNHKAVVSTSTSGTIVSTTLFIQVNGASLNSYYGVSPYNFPTQGCDASIYVSRTGNPVGSYKCLASGATITDVTVGNKQYRFDPNTSNITVTSVDATSVIGYYSGNLIDGSTLVPVSGTFKLQKG